MSCKYNNCKHCGYKSECEIFKENAELKIELSENKVADCHIVNGLCEQLTEAKEILSNILSDNRIMKAQFESEEQANVWFEHIHNAEQFLNEK